MILINIYLNQVIIFVFFYSFSLRYIFMIKKLTDISSIRLIIEKFVQMIWNQSYFLSKNNQKSRFYYRASVNMKSSLITVFYNKVKFNSLIIYYNLLLIAFSFF